MDHQSKKTKPGTSVEKSILDRAEYFKLSRASALLGCYPDDLLHLGATGQIDLMAPVLVERIYTWPHDQDSFAYPEMEQPHRCAFGVDDRVILLPYDLANIEAVGWSIPHRFIAPEKALAAVADADLRYGEGDSPENALADGAVPETKVKDGDPPESALADGADRELMNRPGN